MKKFLISAALCATSLVWGIDVQNIDGRLIFTQDNKPISPNAAYYDNNIYFLNTFGEKTIMGTTMVGGLFPQFVDTGWIYEPGKDQPGISMFIATRRDSIMTNSNRYLYSDSKQISSLWNIYKLTGEGFFLNYYHTKENEQVIEKSNKQEKDIDELTTQLLMTRQDCIVEENMLPYYLLIFDFSSDAVVELMKNIIEKFQNQDLAKTIVLDSWWKLRKETGIKIRPHLNLPSYRIDHIDKFILQDNEKNKELVVWAKNYTDKLTQEAGYLPNQTERGKRKEKTVTTS